MADFEVKINTKELRRAAGALKAQAAERLLKGIEPLVRRRLQEADAAIVLNLTGGVLKRRTGRLAGSVRQELKVGRDRLVGRVGVLKPGPAQKYAGIHITGGTIKPVKAKMLAIPLPVAQAAAGVSRYSSPRQVPGLFLIKSKAGNLLLAKREKDGLTPFFVLKHSVQIPRRDYMEKPVKDLIAGVEKDVQGALAGVLDLKG